MMVPMIEVTDMIMSVIIVNLREVMNDHKSFRNEFFKGISFHKYNQIGFDYYLGIYNAGIFRYCSINECLK